MVALNAWSVALKAKTEDMMTLNAKLTNGSKCQTMNDGFEHQTKDMMLLMSNWRIWQLWMPSWPMALNAKLWTTTLNASSKRQTDECGSELLKTVNDSSERQTNQWLWMPNWRTRTMALNATTVKRWWLWTPSCEEMMRENMSQYGMSLQLAIH